MGQYITRRLIVFALALSTTATSGAHAAIFAFSYDSGAGVLSGKIDGTVEPDGNSIRVNGILGIPRLDGVPVVATPVVTTLATLFTGLAVTPMVSFDGSVAEFAACSDLLCTEGFYFEQVLFAPPLFGSSPAFGASFEVYDASRWTLSIVPEPSSWALMTLGFGAIGRLLRRRGVAGSGI